MRAVCLSNLKQLTLAWILYADANGDRIVSGMTQPYRNRTDNILDLPWVYWHNQHDPAIPEEKKLEDIQEGLLFPYVKDVDLYQCPTGVRGEMRTYSIFASMHGHTFTEGTKGLMIENRMQIRRPAERLVFIDEGIAGPSAWDIYYQVEKWWDPPQSRHSDGTTFGFADGHTEYYKWRDQRTRQHASLPYFEIVARMPLYSPDNTDLRWIQRGVWGDLGYEPSK